MLWLCLAVSLVGIANHGVWSWDEPRVAGISLEMMDSGDYVVPHLGGEAFVEKPPLGYALTAVLIKLLGPGIGNAGAARMMAALSGLGTLLFTYLLARRLVGRERAAASILMLATMYGFVRQTHILRVDATLLLCVAAAVWSFGEAYLGERRMHLWLAGALTGVALLAKGLVGVSFVGMAWLGLFVPWAVLAWRRRADPARAGLGIVAHIGSGLAFSAVVAAWVIPFRASGGEALWDEWFWQNQVGRVSGSSELGHTSDDLELFAYWNALIGYTAPWTPLLLIWCWRRWADFKNKISLTREQIVLLAWGVGGIVLLTASATKRNLYLLPVVPPFAILCAQVIGSTELPRWCRRLFQAVMGTCVVVIAIQVLAPLVPLVVDVPETRKPWHLLFLHPSWYHLLALGGLGVVLYMMRWANELSLVKRVAGALAATYIVIHGVAMAASDRSEGVEREVTAFIDTIPIEERPRVAGYKLAEGMRGSLYFHSRAIFEAVNTDRALQILAGEDDQFDSLVARESEVDRLEAVPSTVEASVYIGARHEDPGPRYRMLWMKGLTARGNSHSGCGGPSRPIPSLQDPQRTASTPAVLRLGLDRDDLASLREYFRHGLLGDT